MLCIVGGTGLSQIDCFESLGEEAIPTPYAKQDVIVKLCRHNEQKLAFLPRHGEAHNVPPHKINYRANIWALHQLSVTHIVAMNAVGGIHGKLAPGQFAVPEQIIDYTSGRDTTFFDDGEEGVHHIDFSHPYDQKLRQALLRAFGVPGPHGMNVMGGGVYGCTNGPRLETAAEVDKFRRDGCDMLGMTGMPEASLARECGIAYACFALSVNWAAGIGPNTITMNDIQRVLDTGVNKVKQVLQTLVEEWAYDEVH